jgi:hypothetical protein
VAAPARPKRRRIKGLPGVRLPLPRKPHQRHEDKRRKPAKHRKRPGEDDLA